MAKQFATIAQEMETESHRSLSIFNEPVNHHERLAILWEEFEEAKLEVFRKEVDPSLLYKELIQIGSVAMIWAAYMEELTV